MLKSNVTLSLSVLFTKVILRNQLVKECFNSNACWVFSCINTCCVEEHRIVERKIKLKENVWFRFFLHHVNNIETWIDFEIEIENLDNEPLEIHEIQLLQNQFYLIADLEVLKNYEIVVDSTLLKPQYDLVKFLPNDLTKLELIRISNFKKISSNKASETQQFWQTKWFLWTALVLAGLIIGYFAFGLLKDVEKKD